MQQEIGSTSLARVVEGRNGPYLTGPGYVRLRGLGRKKNPAERLEHANAALALDPDCIDALLVLARLADVSIRALPFLTRAVRAGDEIWMPVAERYAEQMDWWRFPGVQPFLQALTMLGDAHYCLDNDQAALWCFNRLLRMAPPPDIRGELEERVRELTPAPSIAMSR
jgi:hypothetical protein